MNFTDDFSHQSGLNDDTHLLTDPDPDTSGIEIHGWKLLLLPIRVSDKTKGGVLLPSQTTNDFSYLNTLHKVLKIGPLAYTAEVLKGQAWCKEGDYVMIGRNAGERFKYKGTPLRIVKDTDVLMVVENPESIDQHTIA